MPHGWHRSNRPSVIHPPAQRPKRARASSQYCEQVGTWRQWIPMSGDSVPWYINTIALPIRRGNWRRPKAAIGYLAAAWVPRFASIWSIADTTASNVNIVEAWRAL